jgi:hypothetical protein
MAGDPASFTKELQRREDLGGKSVGRKCFWDYTRRLIWSKLRTSVTSNPLPMHTNCNQSIWSFTELNRYLKKLG